MIAKQEGEDRDRQQEQEGAAAITVQSGRPEPTWLGMKGGAVWARRLVMISAKAYSFHAVMKQNTAVAAMPVAASGMTILKKASMRV